MALRAPREKEFHVDGFSLRLMKKDISSTQILDFISQITKTQV